ncbi:hypothetical protein V8G54_027088 [Vigna mungo]|uniref:Uncharacterized protein n=1 Tax=Vigna mungo TaxID=3915 RepID=A0AAQ3N185_VIGMU
MMNTHIPTTIPAIAPVDSPCEGTLKFGVTVIADIRGPYIPLSGIALVPFPAQDKWISKVLWVTFTLNSLVIPLPTPPASSTMLKSFKYLKPWIETSNTRFPRLVNALSSENVISAK